MGDSSKVDIYINDEELAFVQSKMKAVQEKLLMVSSELESLSQDVASTESWMGNGKEECKSFISLISSFSYCISGCPTQANGEGGLSSKSVSGGSEHMDIMIEAIEQFLNDSESFEICGASNSATTLRNM